MPGDIESGTVACRNFARHSGPERNEISHCRGWRGVSFLSVMAYRGDENIGSSYMPFL